MTSPNAARVAVLAALALGAAAWAQAPVLTPARIAPDELEWTPTATGSQRAPLVGDDQRAGLYVYRSKFPPNYRVEPHFHPDDRVVTVISGTLHMGYGETFDESAMRALPPGSVWTEPARQSHYVWAKNGEVVIQIMGHGPTSSTPAVPAAR